MRCAEGLRLDVRAAERCVDAATVVTSTEDEVRRGVQYDRPVS
ncbi:hypothetical protein ACFV2H_14535 [Streptomyces sp. NPDC059629]